MESARTPLGLRRLANVHLMRTAGTYVNEVLHQSLGPEYRLCNSWRLGLNRDWTVDEVRAFAELPGAVYVHNHVVTWDWKTVQLYRRAKFFLFTFVRDVGDQLCSLYCWMKQREMLRSNLSLNEFVQIQLAGGQIAGIDHRHWQIPSYWRLLDFVDVFTKERFEWFVQEELGIECKEVASKAAYRNGSENLGYQYYCVRGEIDRKTQTLLEESLFQRRFLAVQRSRTPPGKRIRHSCQKERCFSA